MTAHRRRAGRWTATVVGLLLAVQTLLLAVSIGASAAPMPRDRFGNVLCATDARGEHGTPADSSDRHGGRLDCCTAGCPAAGGGLAPATGPAVPVRHPPFALHRPFALNENAAAAAVQPSPRSARAPPFRA